MGGIRGCWRTPYGVLRRLTLGQGEQLPRSADHCAVNQRQASRIGKTLQTDRARDSARGIGQHHKTIVLACSRAASAARRRPPRGRSAGDPRPDAFSRIQPAGHLIGLFVFADGSPIHPG